MAATDAALCFRYIVYDYTTYMASSGGSEFVQRKHIASHTRMSCFPMYRFTDETNSSAKVYFSKGIFFTPSRTVRRIRRDPLFDPYAPKLRAVRNAECNDLDQSEVWMYEVSPLPMSRVFISFHEVA